MFRCVAGPIMGEDQNVVKQEVEDEVFRTSSSSRESQRFRVQLSQTMRTFAPHTPPSKTKLKSSTLVPLFLSVACLVAEKCRKRKLNSGFFFPHLFWWPKK